MRFLAVSALLISLAGCSTVSDPFIETGSIRPDAPPLSSDVAPDFAAALLPAAGAVESVRQTVRDDDLEQTIVYANATAMAGENALIVRVGLPGKGAAFRRAPTRGAILAEMRTSLPGVAMAIEPAPGENMHGVYGYATGTLGASGSCLYAWQYVKRIAPAAEATAVGQWRTPDYAAQVRLRFCDPAIPRERIAALMEGLRLKPVTRETLDMLRFAAGNGGIRARAVPIVAAETVSAAPRRAAKRKAIADEPVGESEGAMRAARVPLPGEVLAEGDAQEAKAATVPLPGGETTTALD